MADEAKETTPPPSGGRTTTEYRDIADALRNRVDLFGKTLAAIATLGTTAVGLNKIGDLFPAGENGYWVALGCLALIAAALAAIGVAVRLMRVARPAFIQPDLSQSPDLDGEEVKEIEPLFEASAKRFGYSSLTGLQERERSLRTAAAHAADPDERVRRTALADEVKAEIENAVARAQVVTVRRRAANAVNGWSWALYVIVLVGLTGFALCADKVSSDRTDLIAEAKACGEARKATATADELSRTNGICESAAEPEDPTPTPPTAAEARAQVAAKLVETAALCASLEADGDDAATRPLTPADCKPVRDAAAAVSGASP